MTAPDSNRYQSLRYNLCWAMTLAILLSACGGGVSGPALQGQAQSVSFGSIPSLDLPGTAQLSASASSGLPVSLATTTPAICSVNASTGVVTAMAAGNCIIAASQGGDAVYSSAMQVTQTIPVQVNANQTISFSSTVTTITVWSTTTVQASASSGLGVAFSSTTPTLCSVDANGLVTGLALGSCVIAANQSGSASIHSAPQVTQSISVGAPTRLSVPGVPSSVSARLGALQNPGANPVVLVTIGSTPSGGSPILSYTVTSTPAGLSATGSSSPVTVTCPGSCAGYAFVASAANIQGSGADSAPVDIVTTLDVVETFYEPDTQPNNSIFTGSLVLDSTSAAVTNQSGTLTESMTGNGVDPSTMTQVVLAYQLASDTSASLGGLLVSSFHNLNTNTFSTTSGGGAWAPGTGPEYYGYNTGAANPGNAYAMVFVNAGNPLAALTPGQVNALAYADCTPGGMMGATCMTGTSVSVYGTTG